MHELGSENEPPLDTPRLYAASLSDYNSGILHGTWIDAIDDSEAMQHTIARMLANSPTARLEGLPAEEWAIHDYEGFGQIRIEEYTSIDTIAGYAAGILAHGLAFSAWIGVVGGIPDEGSFEEAFLGDWASTEEYAESLLDDCGLDEVIDKHVPESLRYYVKIDTAGFARDLQLGGDIIAVEKPSGGVWIFAAN